jgi:hypothetical protein
MSIPQERSRSCTFGSRHLFARTLAYPRISQAPSTQTTGLLADGRMATIHDQAARLDEHELRMAPVG